MSDKTVPEIDPRFDPRFQRGYVPDAAAPASASAPRAASPAPAPAPAPDGGAATDDDPAAAIVRLLAQAPGLAESTQPSQTRQHAAIAEAEEEPFDVGPFTDSPPDEASRFEPWFAAGWMVAVVAAVVGASLWWAAIASENYIGPSNSSDRWLQIVGWTVAPSLIQAGLIGVVSMLVWTGIRHASRDREERP